MSTTTPQPPRTTPLALINLGLPRTGTKSLRKALQILGFPHVYHYDTILPNEHPEHCLAWKEAFHLKYSPNSTLNWTTSDWDTKILSQYQCLSDNPCISFAPELLSAYPGAKILLSVRDSAAAWTRSYGETIWPVEQAFHYPTWNPVKIVHRWYVKSRSPIVAMVVNLAVYSPTKDFKAKGGERVYTEWNEHIREMAKGRQYLEFNVKEGWEPLCRFLGVEVPDEPFPSLNDKTEFLKLWNMEEKEHYQIDWRVWGMAGIGALVPIVAGIILTKDGLFKPE